MIDLYSGTPGSGKSLDVAQKLYWWVRAGKPCICNFQINLEKIKHKKTIDNFLYLDNSALSPARLIDYANKYMQKRGCVKEDSILLVIDECQMLFNSRDWGQRDRKEWLNFFTVHRHYGFHIILVAQFDRMLDRQIRSLIEYEYIHRKVSNYGWKGKLFSAFSLGKLFVSVKVWYPMHEKVGSSFFRAKKLYYSLYDTYAVFDSSGLSMGGSGALCDDRSGTPPILDYSNT